MGEFSYRHAKQKAYSISSPFVFQTLPRLAAAIIRSGSYVTIESAIADRSRLGVVGQFSDWARSTFGMQPGKNNLHVVCILVLSVLSTEQDPRGHVTCNASEHSGTKCQQSANSVLLNIQLR